MSLTLKYILTIIQVLAACFLTFVVLAQSGKSAGLSGAISGGADTFLSKNKSKAWDARLARWTKWIAIGFMLLTLTLTLLPGTATTTAPAVTATPAIEEVIEPVVEDDESIAEGEETPAE